MIPIDTEQLQPQANDRAADIWRTFAALFHQATISDCAHHDQLATRDDDPDFARDTAFVAMVFLDSFMHQNKIGAPIIELNRAIHMAMVHPTPRRWRRVYVETSHAVAHLLDESIRELQGDDYPEQFARAMISKFAAGDWPDFTTHRA